MAKTAALLLLQAFGQDCFKYTDFHYFLGLHAIFADILGYVYLIDVCR